MEVEEVNVEVMEAEEDEFDIMAQQYRGNPSQDYNRSAVDNQ